LRFYEKALELYTKAFGMESTYDAAYNRSVPLPRLLGQD
jgi:hypothetical protein